MKLFGMLALFLLLAALLLWTNLVGAGPAKGPELNVRRFVLPAGHPGKRTIKERFVGGERACVLLYGDHNPVEELWIRVYDDKNNLVAQDEGKGDFSIVVWYPPSDGDFTIEIRHDSAEFNKCYLVIK